MEGLTLLRGQKVKLLNYTEVGEDDFGAPIVEEQEVEVANVLIEPATNDAIVDELSMSGKHLVYILHIPKDDTNNWKDSVVEFYGAKWKTFGDCLVYDPNLTPLAWNKKVKVERFE